ncbi:MAG: ASKHA domain-containing protein, partial [Clostridiales bacterium]|nr:ASKHA domain-containing protein [Clostridiales bacterium]
DEDDFAVVTAGRDEASRQSGSDETRTEPAHDLKGDMQNIQLLRDRRYDIAVDIGTTTLAMSLISCDNAQVIHTVTGVNHQRAYGADVISRIQAANEGHLSELSRCIRQDLYENMLRLLHGSGTASTQIRRIAVAWNTTMGHILMGYSCETLGVYPFEPVDISLTRVSFADFFGTEIILLPGISAYVGADIAAGLLACGFDRTDQVNVLIDLGTNGEMAVGNREKIMVTSTAAGPAFEGGNISCGMGSVPGAVSRVEIRDTEAAGSSDGDDDSVRIGIGAEAWDIVCRTIGGKAPIGLCGTGVIETVYELLKHEWMDETGLLDEAYFDNGFVLARSSSGENIIFTQKDIREVQLAKSAVRAGLETLLLRYGVTYSEIGTLFLAGGFGDRIDLRKAAGIGLLPEELLEKTVAVGDSALRGAAEFLRDTQSEERLDQLIRVSEEVPLASDADFSRFYMEYMLFPE